MFPWIISFVFFLICISLNFKAQKRFDGVHKEVFFTTAVSPIKFNIPLGGISEYGRIKGGYSMTFGVGWNKINLKYYRVSDLVQTNKVFSTGFDTNDKIDAIGNYFCAEYRFLYPEKSIYLPVSFGFGNLIYRSRINQYSYFDVSMILSVQPTYRLSKRNNVGNENIKNNRAFIRTYVGFDFDLISTGILGHSLCLNYLGLRWGFEVGQCYKQIQYDSVDW